MDDMLLVYQHTNQLHVTPSTEAPYGAIGV